MGQEIKLFEGSKVRETFDRSRLDVAEKKLAERSEGSNEETVVRLAGILRELAV